MVDKKLESVLLVDDDKITNFINERLIVKMKITENVKVLTNGKEALDYISVLQVNETKFPALVFLDINMPVMDGFEFIDYFKKIGRSGETMIFMLTTSSNEGDLDRIKHTPQISGYINKPLTEQKIQEVMRSIA